MPVQVQCGSYLDGSVALLEVDEGVVLQLLHALQLPELREGLLQQLLGHRRGQLTHNQHLHLMDRSSLRTFT